MTVAEYGKEQQTRHEVENLEKLCVELTEAVNGLENMLILVLNPKEQEPKEQGIIGVVDMGTLAPLAKTLMFRNGTLKNEIARLNDLAWRIGL